MKNWPLQVESPIEESRLWRRGPDKKGVLSRDIAPGLTSWFWGFTLHFRGELTPQPLKDSGDNILLWNGEIFGGIQVRTAQLKHLELSTKVMSVICVKLQGNVYKY